MDNTSYIALSRQLGLERRLATIANNIANASTTGFKADRTMFERFVIDAGAPRRVNYVQDVSTWRDPANGPLSATGRKLDLALSGPGYFAVRTDAGERYIRGGSFSLSEIGEIVDQNGHPLLDEDGEPLVPPADVAEISIDPTGAVFTDAGVVGRLGVWTFEDEQLMERLGDNLYATDQPPEPAEETRVAQGMLEGSNVIAIAETTRMIDTLRAFQATQKLIETEHDLERQAIERILETSA